MGWSIPSLLKAELYLEGPVLLSDRHPVNAARGGAGHARAA